MVDEKSLKEYEELKEERLKKPSFFGSTKVQLIIIVIIASVVIYLFSEGTIGKDWLIIGGLAIVVALFMREERMMKLEYLTMTEVLQIVKYELRDKIYIGKKYDIELPDGKMVFHHPTLIPNPYFDSAGEPYRWEVGMTIYGYEDEAEYFLELDAKRNGLGIIKINPTRDGQKYNGPGDGVIYQKDYYALTPEDYKEYIKSRGS